ncbi:MAG: arginase [Planctomycetota bacterium]|jgi:arginase
MDDRVVGLIGVPMDLGGGRRGVDMGPSALRIAGIEKAMRNLGMGFKDLGNIPVDQPESLTPSNVQARFLDEIAAACRGLRDRVLESLGRGEFPLVVGGDHSIACGTIAGVSTHFARRNERVGLIWFDAHGDMNTPDSSPSGNIHGMPLASCLGYGLDELTRLGETFPMVDLSHTVAIGVRSLDRNERNIVKETGLRVFTMREIDKRGMHDVMLETLEIVTADTVGFHVSFDMDGSDPSVAPGVGTPVPGGLNFRECHLFMEMVAETGKLVSLEVTEINPILDIHNKTAQVAVGLIQSAMGKLVL